MTSKNEWKQRALDAEGELRRAKVMLAYAKIDLRGARRVVERYDPTDQGPPWPTPDEE